MSPWRLFPLGTHNAYMNMAMDEAIMNAVAESRAPDTLRLYRWEPSAVSIGRFQDVDEAVNLEACRDLNIDVVRRITGGGAVYHDYEGEITYSLIARDLGSTIPRDTLQAYGVICGGIVRALRDLGLSVEFRGDKKHSCPDVLINGRKVSGNAQTRRRGVILQHGTILLNLNPRIMSKILRIPHVGTGYSLARRLGEKVTSVTKELGRSVSFEEMYSMLVGGFQESLRIDFEKDQMTDLEMRLAGELYVQKYSDPGWNLRGAPKIESGHQCL